MACLLGFALKLLAIALQQEVIGRRMGRSVRVRAACSINSRFMRCARCVLEEPQPFSWGKVRLGFTLTLTLTPTLTLTLTLTPTR